MTASEWTPTHDRQHPPFEPGNAAALRHGARSPRVIAPLARELVEQTLADPALAYLGEPRYSPALEAWARAEARVRLLTAFLEEHAADGVGTYKVTRGALDELHRAETRAASERRELGLTPLAAARLGKDIAAKEKDDAVKTLTELREQHERSTGVKVIDGE